ncbi:MAG: DUF4079 domain-containing protein [Symploca sp. SIO3C6]|uniref:DUF4079 domain-containing protein n=1 Tax=Symploca sp. SIO1C4 TaxID=2607765 RepID=A0A6B3NFV0_9CYAN|nr:DUF4079 domain-containing protein [Symploca sp. SIO3C6]NER32186.1 DUF4079 domain-containing protein [Symploca sp. SIO1C4]NET04987.1 DUF4079 domain-containing protein [Symploca sp. SIO2B6]
MDLPSFLWLWKIAAWSMGFTLFAYLLMGISGITLFFQRQFSIPRTSWLRPLHYITGWIMVGLVLLLLAIGIVGTLGHYGSLGHSGHLIAGLLVVFLVLVSAGSATQISPKRSWARIIHVCTNILLLVGFAGVTFTGWEVVQKYLP